MDERPERDETIQEAATSTGDPSSPAVSGSAAGPDGARLWTGPQGLMLGLISSGIGLHAFNQFAIVAAMPLAAAELGGRDWFSWVYSLYFIGSIAGGTTAASLRDRLGVRLSLGLASLLFAAGGLVAMVAPSFGFIVAGRLMQGVADGLIVAICYSLIPANFPSGLIARVFAVEATVWAVTALLGPLVGGLIAEHVSWRASFLAVVPLIAALSLFTALTRPKVSNGASADGDAQGKTQARTQNQAQAQSQTKASPASFPPLTIGLFVTAAFVLALSSARSDTGWQAATLVVGLAILLAGVRLDGRIGVPLFPAETFKPGSVLGRGFLVLFLMSASHSAGSTYLALLVREVFGLGPAAVGYVVVTMAVTWSAVAMVANRITKLARRHTVMRAGPLFQVLGFMAIAAGIGLQFLPLVIAGQMALGAGFGLAWASINQAAMEAAEESERDRASALLPTMSTAGYAVGAALSGTIATATGLAASLGAGSAGDTATWLYGTAAIGALASFLLAFRVRLKG